MLRNFEIILSIIIITVVVILVVIMIMIIISTNGKDLGMPKQRYLLDFLLSGEHAMIRKYADASVNVTKDTSS